MKKIVLSDDGQHATAVEKDGVRLSLKHPVPIDQLANLKPILDAMEELDLMGLGKDHEWEEAELDAEAQTEWTDSELEEFIGELTKHQRAYLEVLAATTKDWMTTGEVLERLKKKSDWGYTSQSIAGIRQGLTRRAKNWYKHETVDESVWEEDLWMNRERIKPKYLPKLRKLLTKS